MTPKLASRKTAKMRFLLLYTVSILLILVLAASFTQGRNLGGEKAGGSGSSAAAARIAVDDLLHAQLEKLEGLQTRYASDTSRAAANAIQAEKASFFAVVDSIRRSASLLPVVDKEAIETLLATFSRSAESGVVVLKGTTSSGNGGATQAEMDELKEILAQKEQHILELEKAPQGAGGSQAILQEKDNTITALQNKINSLEATLAQQPRQSQAGGDASAAEWRDRYNKLKETTDQLRSTNQRYESQANALKNSYKEVIEDNKRLASQIQALKAGKN